MRAEPLHTGSPPPGGPPSWRTVLSLYLSEDILGSRVHHPKACRDFSPHRCALSVTSTSASCPRISASRVGRVRLGRGEAGEGHGPGKRVERSGDACGVSSWIGALWAAWRQEGQWGARLRRQVRARWGSPGLLPEVPTPWAFVGTSYCTWIFSQNNLAQKRVAMASLQTLGHSSFLTSTKWLKPPPGLICLT